MAARRISVTSLSSWGTRPFAITLNGHEVHLRISNFDQATALVDGSPLASWGTNFDSETLVPMVNLDLLPVFDGNGRPVAFTDQWRFVPGSAPIYGVVIQVYWDDDLPTPASR
jgi:hypothetical protein